MKKCVNCKRRKPRKGYTHGLCWKCSLDASIRSAHQSKSKFCPKGEPTAEEVEATVAEQMKRLPEWWNNSTIDDNAKRIGPESNRKSHRNLFTKRLRNKSQPIGEPK